MRSGAKHFDQDTLNQRLIDAGWEGLKPKEVESFLVDLSLSASLNRNI